MIKKYRGINYEVEVPEVEGQNNAEPVKRKKYRGKFY
ncbi:hypothetical protein Xen7305DRAFT_00000140 [Xenococcus sp. PCC 7305]|nr:hypothetical protein Xen7305DRAFT_00000140 [Xenococcus sp. PCC 7305]